MEMHSALQHYVSGSVVLYNSETEQTMLHSVKRGNDADGEPIYDVYLVTVKPVGVVRRTSKPHPQYPTWPSMRTELRYGTPDGKKHTKLKAAANHLLEAQ